MRPFLAKMFNKKAVEAPAEPAVQDRGARLYVSTLIPRSSASAGKWSYFCMAAEQTSGGLWHVYRHRFVRGKSGQLHPYSTMAFPTPDKLCSLEVACARLLAFERDHRDRKGRFDKLPDRACALADMVRRVADMRIEAARQAGGAAIQVAVARRHRQKSL